MWRTSQENFSSVRTIRENDKRSAVRQDAIEVVFDPLHRPWPWVDHAISACCPPVLSPGRHKLFANGPFARFARSEIYDDKLLFLVVREQWLHDHRLNPIGFRNSIGLTE